MVIYCLILIGERDFILPGLSHTTDRRVGIVGLFGLNVRFKKYRDITRLKDFQRRKGNEYFHI